MDKAAVRRLFLSLVARLPVPTARSGEPLRILLLRPDHLGDLLFMTPALHALRLALPEAHLACLVGPWGQPILAGNRDIDELLVCDFPWFNRRARLSSWQPYTVLWREARRLRQSHFDVAVTMRFDFWWGAWLARLAGIPRRIGYDIADVRPFLSEAIPYQPGLHEVQQNLRLVEAIASLHPLPAHQESWQEEQPGAGPLRFTISTEAAAWAAARLGTSPTTSMIDSRQSAIENRKSKIAIHPGAGAAVKLWDAQRWADVANELARRHGATIVLTGGPGELPLVQAIAGRLTAPCINLAGQTNLSQLAAVFAQCALVMGSDSGPLHLAVATGTPTVHLFGPSDPKLFGPWGDPQRHSVVQARYFDSPCRNRPCNRLDYTPSELPGHPCLQTITVDDVLAAAERVYIRSQNSGIMQTSEL